ncbi:aldehyde dehydrogenase family protein [Jannaschia seohaensis]|uniref:Aldehyde dehydrogenase (NAD+) n=1 Tax=Jannaschia seohaensis TaxID=475081 RepID=A0A2Y9B4C9_9RHOB|nr:aldehyde dehydrogenase family protein [Jannaschia seohaensis]PWJ13835.1 aldehyde dehydrogenase (NAD+) [Jannaschia seohaensis]SSA50348.1 aldehyde dehydrogenase (NAD+) [Jannaschia seohaensis]
MSDQATLNRTDLKALDHWIDGATVASAGGAYLETVNPMTGQPHLRVASGTAEDVAKAVAAAERARDGWRRFNAAERGRLMLGLAHAIRANRDRLAEMERADSGKPLAGALAEIEGSAQYFEFYGSLVYLPTGDVLDVAPDQHVFTKREPYGVIGVITPWNLPLNQAARAIAPALVAGNVVVAKPSEITSQTTIEMARLASEVGFPKGVINIVLGTGLDVGEAIVRNESVRKVAFTGSVGVGRAIGRIAAERIIPLTLELGGKSANIIFEDADLDLAAAEAVKGFTLNAGQVCSAGTRILVQRSVYEAFTEKMRAEVAKIKPGENLGPIITPAQFQRVQSYFKVAEEDGARVLAGGKVATVSGQEGGFYIEPTVYADVNNAMRIAQEEIFGPVGVAIPFDTEEDAIRIANDSDYGLIGTLWSRDISRALRVADRIEAGQIFVNVWNTMSVQTPFGGHKNSGYGREKGIEAIHHYSHVKTVTVKI